MTSSSPSDLAVEAAKKAVEKYGPPVNSDIEIAIDFFENVLPSFVATTSNDRLVKAGRSIKSLIDLANEEDTDTNDFPLKESLELLIEECRLLLVDNNNNNKVKVPKVRFGKTEIQMPIATLGCMRFQQEWGPRITQLNQVGSDCQDNLIAILQQAIEYDMTHIETARGYGCSELQLGVALKQLFITQQIKREDLIIQTKIVPNKDPQAFRKDLETSFKNLQLEYIDLFAFHGLHTNDDLEWILGNDNNNEGEDNNNCCMKIIQEYKDAGKIRHVGFSTHGKTEFILKCINTDAFDYVNLHYHYFGSYTASGGGHDGNGNLDCVKLLQEKDMGIFIISPYDKGGRLYEPSRTLRKLTLPDMEPMTFKTWWIWNHHRLQHVDDGSSSSLPQLHTCTIGAARPSDLDQPATAAYLHATKPDETLIKLQRVVNRLNEAKIKALGEEWVKTWWKGLPKSDASKSHIEHNQIVWIYNSIQAFGMYEFGKARYNSFEKNAEKWDYSLPFEKNVEKVGRIAWGFVPGLPLKPGTNYDDELKDVPEANKARVKEAEAFVYKWCHSEKPDVEKEKDKAAALSFIHRTFSVSSQMLRLPFIGGGDNNKDEKKNGGASGDDKSNENNNEEPIPKGWEPAYDMRTWPDFPDRAPRL